MLFMGSLCLQDSSSKVTLYLAGNDGVKFLIYLRLWSKCFISRFSYFSFGRDRNSSFDLAQDQLLVRIATEYLLFN
jgi:hypothetical protein